MQAAENPPAPEQRLSRRTLLGRTGRALSVLVIGGLTSPAFACSRLPAANAITISFAVSEYRLILAEVRVDDRPALALLDTGGATGLQLASTLVRELGLAVEEEAGQRQRLDGSTRRRQAGMVSTFALGGFRRERQRFEMVEGDIERIAQQVGTSFEVILGWGFFSQWQATFDYGAARLELREPSVNGANAASPAAPSSTETPLTLPFTATAGVPLVDGLIGETPVRFVVDTGAPFSTLDRGFASSLPAPAGRETVPYRGQQVPLDVREVAFGDQRRAVAFLPKDLAALQPIGAVGVLGNSLLTQHRLTFDPTRSVVRLA